ncbi:MAG: hypothetical protein II708_06365 [Paludibacteraceae bacterium]|nr:hypothetical protein [Paludibacteraceae bacterium]
MVSYLQIRNEFISSGCFCVNQVLLMHPNFNVNNIYRWAKQELLVPLRQGWYAFPETLKIADFERYVAARIYRPSYISLHYTLSFYGMIPEAVSTITSVTTNKTLTFDNKFGHYSYQSVKEPFFYGYIPKTDDKNRTFYIATPEKALLDLLYLYPQYNTVEDMENLRLDESFMSDEFNAEKFMEYCEKAGNKALTRRAKTVLNTYCTVYD